MYCTLRVAVCIGVWCGSLATMYTYLQLITLKDNEVGKRKDVVWQCVLHCSLRKVLA
jgi:hypothetical protein